MKRLEEHQVYRLKSGDTIMVEKILKENESSVIARVWTGNLRSGYVRRGIKFNYKTKKFQFAREWWEK